MIVIDDNFLDEQTIREAEKAFLGMPAHFPWFYHSSTNPEVDGLHVLKSEAVSEGVLFSGAIYEKDQVYPLIHKIFVSFLIKNKITCKQIIRIKANLYPQVKDYAFHSPHVDTEGDHKVFLYYVDDSDGDTVLFDQKFNGIAPSDLTVKKSVSPKAGKGMVFDGLHYHASSSPVLNKTRCTINIDFI